MALPRKGLVDKINLKSRFAAISLAMTNARKPGWLYWYGLPSCIILTSALASPVASAS